MLRDGCLAVGHHGHFGLEPTGVVGRGGGGGLEGGRQVGSGVQGCLSREIASRDGKIPRISM